MCNFLIIKAFIINQTYLVDKFMRIKNTFMVIITIVFSLVVTSQEGLPIYTDYLTDNYYLIHPSMAGAANCAKIRLTARQQWFGQDDAPKL